MLFQPFEGDLPPYRVLELALADDRFGSLTVVVAWGKESGLRRIRPLLSAFRKRGGTARIILGIDEGGASVEGLRSAISDFDEATVLHDASGTFHPKLYILDGETASVIVVGSSNLTRGGLFANYEAGVCLDLDLILEADAQVHETVTQYTKRLLDDSTSQTLTEELIQQLLHDPRYPIGTEANPKHNGIAPDQPDGSPLLFGMSQFAKHKDPAPGPAGTSQQPSDSANDGSAVAQACATHLNAKTPAPDEKLGEAAWRHKEVIDKKGSITRAESLAIRRQIYGPGPAVQRTVTLFGKKGSNSILWMDHQEDGRTRNEDPVGLTDEGTRIAELWQASQTTADTSA
jgi:HKD family nuclease